MFKFFDSVTDFLINIISFFSNFINSLMVFFETIFDSFELVFGILSFVPEPVFYCLVTLVCVSVLYLILGRE